MTDLCVSYLNLKGGYIPESMTACRVCIRESECVCVCVCVWLCGFVRVKVDHSLQMPTLAHACTKVVCVCMGVPDGG